MDFSTYCQHLALAPSAKKASLLRKLTRDLIEGKVTSSKQEYQKLVQDNISCLRVLSEKVNPKKKLNIAILGYSIKAVGSWDPENIKNGLPGSEECAVYASDELSRQGHLVTLYMDPPEESLWRSPFANPRWLPVDLWDSPNNNYRYDLVLMWRRFDLPNGRKRGDKVFFWPHDSPYSDQRDFPSFDGICFLSNHHRQQFLTAYPSIEKIPYTICGNGLLLSQFPSPAQIENVHSIGYFSNYSRGLEVLVNIWPEVLQHFPTATLDICYGRETWGTLSDEKMKKIVSFIESNSSVRERGKVGHQELANIMSSTSIWAYPCTTTAETFCITAVKCQAAGCIPVTTRIGALAETVEPSAPGVAAINSPRDVLCYLDFLLQTLSSATANKNDRQIYIDFGRKFTWEVCVCSWLELLSRV